MKHPNAVSNNVVHIQEAKLFSRAVRRYHALKNTFFKSVFTLFLKFLVALRRKFTGNKGIPVDAIPSSIGLGWGLYSGGQITRDVHGLEDDVIVNPTGDPALPTRYYGLFTKNTFATDRESEPDLFTASFGGRTIKFTIGPKKSDPSVFDVLISPRCNVTVVKSTNGLGQLTFKVTDEMWNNFYFEPGDVQNIICKEGSKTFTYSAIQSWNLVKVVSATGQQIKYTYNKRNLSYPQYKNEVVKEHFGNGTGQATPDITVQTNEIVNYNGSLSYLQKIEYPNGVVADFVYRTSVTSDFYGLPLQQIKITQRQGSTSNSITYELNQSYFHTPWHNYNNTEIPLMLSYMDVIAYFASAPNVNADSLLDHIKLGLRLKLNSITKTGNDGATQEPYYSFEYNSLPLPPRLSPAKDCFGYYNNKAPVNINTNVGPMNDLSGLTIPLHTYASNGVNFYTYGTDRSPDFNYAKAWTLNTIKNGAGGKITIYYKDHVLYNPVNGYDGLSGISMESHIIKNGYENANDGLCVDKVVFEDGFNSDNNYELRYEYNDGQRFFRGGYYYSGYYYEKMYRNFMVSPIRMVNGANHGYTSVEEKKIGYNGTLIGSTVTTFTNLMLSDQPGRSNMRGNATISGSIAMNDTTAGDYNTPAEPLYMLDYRMGVPVKREIKDMLGNITSRTELTYEDSLVLGQYGIGPDRYFSHVGMHYGYGQGPTFSNKYFFACPYRLSKKKETQFTNNGSFEKETSYTYNFPGNLYDTKWTEDNGVINVKRNIYDLWKYNYVIGSSLFRIENGTENVVDLVTSEFGTGSFNVKPISTSRLYNPSVISSSNAASMTKTSTEFTAYDSKSNLLEVHNVGDNSYSATIWDSRLGTAVATISNAQFADVAYTSFEGDFLNGPDPDKGNWDFDYASVRFVSAGMPTRPMTGHYYYELSRINNVTSVNNLTNGKKYVLTVWATEVPTLSVTNANVSYSFTQQMQVGSWKLYTAVISGFGGPVAISNTQPANILLDELRLYPVEATMSTVVPEPLFGVQASCDPYNNIIYTEYDAMGRPSVQRDINWNVLSVSKTVVSGADNQ